MSPVVIADLPRVVVPIFEQVDRPLPALGSGFFFMRRGGLFLVTAHHVTEPLPDGPKRFTVPVSPEPPTQLASIGGGRLVSAPQEDVAVFHLQNKETIDDVMRRGWRVLSDSDVERVALDHGVVSGWPHARLRPKDEGLKGELLAYNVRAIKPPAFAENRHDCDIFLSWPKDTEDPVPNLAGISGSPIWSRHLDQLHLAGVQKAVVHGEYIRATRWSVVDVILREKFRLEPAWADE